MTPRLRALLAHTHVDQDGRAVVYADALAPVVVATEAEQERLTLELAKASGRTVEQARWDVLGRTGSGDWLEPLGDPGGTESSERGRGGAESGTPAVSVNGPSEHATPGGDT